MSNEDTYPASLSLDKMIINEINKCDRRLASPKARTQDHFPLSLRKCKKQRHQQDHKKDFVCLRERIKTEKKRNEKKSNTYYLTPREATCPAEKGGQSFLLNHQKSRSSETKSHKKGINKG
jgi:hypothetical protein